MRQLSAPSFKAVSFSCTQHSTRKFCEKALSTAAPSTAPSRLLARSLETMEIRADCHATAVVLHELPPGELVEAYWDLEAKPEWLLVRRPLEDNIEVMSDKPLLYEAGWIHNPKLERAKFQLGENVSVRVDQNSLFALEMARKMPFWSADALPAWLTSSFAEVNGGKIAGIVQQDRFMVQRPSGAIPERLAVEADVIMRRRQLAKRTAVGALVGALAATALGFAGHTLAWAQGAPIDRGTKGWPKFIGWVTVTTVFINPAAYAACFSFATSQMGTAALVVWLDMLLYQDLFGE